MAAVPGQVGQDDGAAGVELRLRAAEQVDQRRNRPVAHQDLTHLWPLRHVTHHGRRQALEQGLPAAQELHERGDATCRAGRAKRVSEPTVRIYAIGVLNNWSIYGYRTTVEN